MVIRILNPHGLRVVDVWPTLKAVGLEFKNVEALLKGQSLRTPAFVAGIIESMANDMGRIVEVKQ